MIDNLLTLYERDGEIEKIKQVNKDILAIYNNKTSSIEEEMQKWDKAEMKLVDMQTTLRYRNYLLLVTLGLLLAFGVIGLLLKGSSNIKTKLLDQIQTKNQELSSINMELTVQKEKVEHQRKLLQEQDTIKSNFFTNISHEFRTPLTVISGMTDQILEHEKEKNLIKRNAKNLLDLINQILDLAKLESKSLKVNFIQDDVVKYVRYLCESFHSLANSRNIRLQMECHPSFILMNYDPEKLRKIVSNLLSNAIKHSSSGDRILVTISSQSAPEVIGEEKNAAATNYLSLIVKDTGVGISGQELPKIFDRFYRVNDKENKAGGTGIGLALTKELIQLLEGDIQVESELGKGSVFKVLLPIYQNVPLGEVAANISLKEDPIIPTPSLAMVGQTSRKSTYNGVDQANLLIIEDNSDVVEYLVSCLEDHYNLDFAYNGKVGVEKALETIPDLIISDVMMPEKDGFEVCEELKNDERSSHIPIVLLTAKADVESRIAGISRGADAYLKKPFYQKELLAVLQNLFEIRKKLQARYTSFITQGPTTEEVPIAEKELTIEDAFLQTIRDLVEKDLSSAEFGMPQLCRGIGMSRSQIYKKVKALTGRSPSQFIRSIRLYHAQKLLKKSEMNISEVAYEVGFSSPVYFSNAFFKEFGIRPKEFVS